MTRVGAPPRKAENNSAKKHRRYPLVFCKIWPSQESEVKNKKFTEEWWKRGVSRLEVKRASYEKRSQNGQNRRRP